MQVSVDGLLVSSAGQTGRVMSVIVQDDEIIRVASRTPNTPQASIGFVFGPKGVLHKSYSVWICYFEGYFDNVSRPKVTRRGRNMGIFPKPTATSDTAIRIQVTRLPRTLRSEHHRIRLSTDGLPHKVHVLIIKSHVLHRSQVKVDVAHLRRYHAQRVLPNVGELDGVLATSDDAASVLDGRNRTALRRRRVPPLCEEWRPPRQPTVGDVMVAAVCNFVLHIDGQRRCVD